MFRVNFKKFMLIIMQLDRNPLLTLFHCCAITNLRLAWKKSPVLLQKVLTIMQS